MDGMSIEVVLGPDPLDRHPRVFGGWMILHRDFPQRVAGTNRIKLVFGLRSGSGGRVEEEGEGRDRDDRPGSSPPVSL